MKRRAVLFSLALVPVLPALLAAQMPPPAAPRPFEFPKHAKKVLPNGLTVFVVEDTRQPLVSFSLQILAGGASEPSSKAGLSSLTASLLREGTATRSSQEISKAVDLTGGSLGASSSDDVTSVSGTFMKSYATRGMELLADIVQNPKFEQAEIDRRMRQLQSSLAVQYNSAEYLAPLLAARGILGTHPYAYPGGGTPETLRNIGRDDIVAFHKTHYSPARAYLAVAGDMKPEEAFALVEKHLGGWKTPAPSELKLPPPPAAQAKVLVLDKPDSNQTQIVIGQPGVARNHPDYVALSVANQIFGGSFNSRLNLKLRANEGLTYGASSSLTPQRQAGLFTLATSTRTEKTNEAIQFMVDLLKDWKKNPATPEEFAEAKNYLIGVFGLSLETSSAVAQRVVNTAIYGLPENYWTNYRKELEALTMEQTVAAVQRFLQPEQMTTVTVGNSAQYAEGLAKLGPVTKLAIPDLDLVADNLVRKKETVVAGAEGTAKARALVEAAAAAMGGKEKLLAVQSMHAKGGLKLTTPQGELEASSEEWIVYPDKYKMTLVLGAMGEVVQAVDGTSGYMAQGPNSRDLPPPMTAELKKGIVAAGGLGMIATVLQGKAEAVAIDDSTIQWKMGDFEAKLQFDPATGLIRKMNYRSMGMGGMSETESQFEDYREVDGLKLPGREVILQNGQPFGVRTLTERHLNQALDPALFKKP